MSLDTTSVIGVVGAGAMGLGIAQVAATRGHQVVIADMTPQAIVRARSKHRTALDREVDKGRMTRAAAEETLERLSYVQGAGELNLGPFATCDVVIEAIIEDAAAKRALFAELQPLLAPEAIIATNTSSLSVALLAAACPDPSRVVGIHFFNPAQVMPLVELVPAITTAPRVLTDAFALVRGWGKTVVVASDTPGFIVNRVARLFYGESLRMLEEGIADRATIDWALRTLGGFKMGPFELMDFIGNDVNYAVTCSVFEAMFYDPRYKPALTQRRLVEAGLLGRKSGRGYYDYRDGAPPMPAPTEDEALGRRIVDRVLAMLVNEAADALYMKVASAFDIDLAMTKGVNYPKGLLAWGDEIGAATVLARLEALQAEYGEDRYRPSPLLRRVVAAKGRLVG